MILVVVWTSHTSWKPSKAEDHVTDSGQVFDIGPLLQDTGPELSVKPCPRRQAGAHRALHPLPTMRPSGSNVRALGLPGRKRHRLLPSLAEKDISTESSPRTYRRCRRQHPMRFRQASCACRGAGRPWQIVRESNVMEHVTAICRLHENAKCLGCNNQGF